MNIIVQNFVSFISLRIVSRHDNSIVSRCDNINLTYHTNGPPPLSLPHGMERQNLKHKTCVQWSFNTKISQTI